MSTTQTTGSTDLLTKQTPADASPEKAATGRGKRRRPRILLWLCVAWLVILALLAIFADFLPHDYEKPIGDSNQPPFKSWPEFLGTDGLGRSVLSRIVFGARVSLTVSLVSAIVGVLVGGVLGLLAAHFRGVVEAIIDIVADALLAFPPLILLLALASALKPSLTTITIGLAILTVPGFTRLTKANAIAQSNREYVVVSKAMGAGSRRIIFKELMPNTFPSVLSYSVIVMAVLIVAEGSLSFLGQGIPPPNPSWGGMIVAGKDNLSDHASLVFVPCVALFLTVFSFNVIGDYLRSRFDVRDTKL